MTYRAIKRITKKKSSYQIERHHCEAIFPASVAVHLFEATSEGVCDAYLSFSSALLYSLRKQLYTRKEWTKSVEVVQIVLSLESVASKYDQALAGTHKLLTRFQQLFRGFLMLWARTFGEYIEDLRTSAAKTGHLADDGTVHEIALNTANILKKSENHLLLVESTLVALQRHKIRSPAGTLPRTTQANEQTVRELAPTNNIIAADGAIGVERWTVQEDAEWLQYPITDTALSGKTSATREWFESVITLTIAAIDQKAKLYKRAHLSMLFLLNNYHYLSKMLRGPFIATIVTPRLAAEVEQKIIQTRAMYLASWGPVCQHLQNAPQSTGVLTALSSSEKQMLKDRFKAFNSDLNELIRLHTMYIVPDMELKMKLIDDISNLLVVPYDSFLHR